MLDGLKLLLVEDDHFVQLDLQYMLEDAGATVVTAASIQEANGVLDDRYHAAILDIRLPDGEARPIAEGLAAKDVPIIFHSGESTTTDWVVGFPKSVALSKPVPENVLIETVRDQTAALG